MTAQSTDRPQSHSPHPDEAPDGSASADGTETAKKGGKEAARRQAEQDWQNSAKESGE